MPNNTVIESGNYDAFRFGASVATPLFENKIYFSGSYLRHQTDCFVKNIYKDDGQAARHQVDTGRSMLRFTPVDELDVRLSLDATYNEDGRGTMRFGTGPNRSGRFRVRADGSDKYSSNFILPGLAADYAGESVKISSITSYMDYDYRMKSDIDRTPAPIGVSNMKIDQYNFAQELRLASADDHKLSWVAGMFLGRTSMSTDMDRLRQRAAGSTALHTKYAEETEALFGQATYSILDNLRLTAGFRVEHTRLDGGRTWGNGLGIRRDYGKDARFTEFLSMASLLWNITDNVTTYATWSQSYLPGGFKVFTASNENNFFGSRPSVYRLIG